MKRYYRMLATAFFLAMISVLAGCSSTDYIVLNPKGMIGETQKDLIIISTLLCAIIIVPTLILTAVIVWRYRDKPGRKAPYKPNWEHNTKLEVTWWTIPIIIVIILGVITVDYTYKLEPSVALKSDKEPIEIQVTSMDWKWLFTYPEEDIATVNYLKIPEDVPIRFKITSDTAMNSFWIPQLGGQIYSMSGMAMTLHLQADEKGTYFGSGANFNGEHFAQMTFKTDAVSQEEYDAWIKEVKGSSPSLTMEGYEKLTTPGASEVKLFSSFPEGLFNDIVRQYVEEGSSGAHDNHGGATAEPTEKDTKKDATEENKENTESTNTDEHAGH
ncbi:ubiquinol oxidase subunit II [Paenibacillus sp. GSMTC-2017]|uniref:ubiquinol oxidase subunit II n=1 Tax=Paenibacillus sp. GSMTC-2017 TaxID=2794350 RepID=UPI0018D926AE|nr:ubiquinol oxidase subunit II [Paenibacillus sp. GSMTC-2017]MBH5319840.1 ubiquinol oxidase subunit II [Paenibacillus sp. GSMTC-2017]